MGSELDTLTKDSPFKQMHARRRQKKEKFLLKRKPQTQAEWVALADALMGWAKTTKADNINVFSLEQGYGPYRLRKWVHDDSYFAEAFEYVCGILSAKREEIAKDRKYDNKLLLRLHPLYDWSLADYERNLAEATSSKKDKVELKLVYDPTTVPTTGIVPDKPITKEDNETETDQQMGV